MSQPAKTWLGTPLPDFYEGKGPWSFSIPPVNPSKFHHVLYELPATLLEPPKPHYNREPQHWDDDHVRMPYCQESFYLTKINDEEVIKPRWDIINEAFSNPINSVEEFEKAVNSYNSNKLPKFTALYRLFEESLEEEETQYFFQKILPGIVKLALSLPELLPGSLPLLKKQHCKSISVSQLQVASLLANAFLCTFVWRKEVSTFPGANFIRLFAADQRVKRRSCVTEKLKCLMNYFRRVINTKPVGVITFERKCIPRGQIPRWDNLETNIGNTKVHIDSSGVIEGGLGFLQVDFANKFVGGGVLGYGCVQEEIRFIICPELIISRLFTEELGDSEAVIITGVETYSKYSGYSDDFKWEGNFEDDTPFDEYGRRRTSLLVIDATRFNKAKDQFHASAILRELNKAYVGFSSREKTNVSPVATGNWGCGAYKGDPHLKSLLQLMACSAANRDLVYYSFGNDQLRDSFYNMYLFLASNGITICQLWRYLCRFCVAKLGEDKLYSFIQQCHFDLKSQPTLKKFFTWNIKSKDSKTSTPSTSGANVEEESKNVNSEMKKKEDNCVIAVNETENVESTSRNTNTKIRENKTQNVNDDIASPEDIIKLIGIIDGNVSCKRKEEEEFTTLFTEIDKMNKRKEIVKHESGDEEEIAMEVDYVEEKAKVNFKEEKKKKITDYFSKK